MTQCLILGYWKGILWLTGNIIGNTAQNATTITGIHTNRDRSGVDTIAASHITSLIIPFKSVNKYNENLKKRLGIDLAGF
ncbi:P13 family porin [Borreliella bissettiae]|uniref:P13 family porin n=1 Tax=Borrelia bissettiae TaxID=64897 RepID=UPI0009F953CD|nr:P13 family porin [Borreliella bissettiae]MCD2401584.1 P13 family porin [Borreliella bissettiae]